MNFKYTTKVLVALTVFAAATSCSDNDKWKPGPDVNSDCMSVYFEPMSNYNLIIEPDNSHQLPINIGRSRTDEAATVKLIVNSCPEGAEIPSSVSFKAGEQTAVLYVNVENMPSKSSGIISLAIPTEEISPYAAGKSELNLNVTISGKWETLAKDAEVNFGSAFSSMKTDLFMLELTGTPNFKLPDCLGSGLDFTFTVEEPGSGNLKIVPITNFKDVHDRWGADYDYNGWFFYDFTEESYAAWSPDGSYPGISDMEFDSDYSYVNFTEGVIYFSTYTTYEDGNADYLDVYIHFDPIFDPFAVPGEGE